MITILSGVNSFSLQRVLEQRVAAFVAEQGDLALERLDGQEVDYARLQESVTSLPFLAPKKLVVLRAPSANKQFVERAEQLFDELPETTDLVVVEPKLDKRSVYYKYLKKQPGFQEFNELDVQGLAQWLVGLAKDQNGSISLSDARYLAERVGLNQQFLSNELEKLLLNNAHITRTSIDSLTEATPQSTIFELLEAVFSGRTKRTLDLYAEQRALKVEPQHIIAMLTWQLHIIALIKAASDTDADQLAHDAKLSPYVVRKSQTIARKITGAKLKELVADLLQIDQRSKRSALDLDEALQHFFLKLAS